MDSKKVREVALILENLEMVWQAQYWLARHCQQPDQPLGESAEQPLGESADQSLGESADQSLGESADRASDAPLWDAGKTLTSGQLYSIEMKIRQVWSGPERAACLRLVREHSSSPDAAWLYKFQGIRDSLIKNAMNSNYEYSQPLSPSAAACVVKAFSPRGR